MELLARFELATVLPQNRSFVGALNDLAFKSALWAWDEIAGSKGIRNKKSAISIEMTDFLELLARFELATSSLPRMRSTG